MLDKDSAAQHGTASHGTTNHTTSSHYTTPQQAAVHWGAAFVFHKLATPTATQAQGTMSHTLLTKREATKRARVSERTFDRVLASGAGPTTTRIGARVLIREDHLDAWIERCADQPSQKAA
ncbi:MAG: Helix-turn-helix domain [Acetobacteraceae bacterium]|nr:Helix-turn-helix domain [Acetobacteraceae bacterium]